MNHWQMIAIAYGLTFAALAVEIRLLFHRRKAALRQARAGDGASETGRAEGLAEAREELS